MERFEREKERERKRDFFFQISVIFTLKKKQFPARSTFAVAGLPKEALVEIEAIAVPSGQPQQE
jgi:enamine deaminase RidA (YjgF/YER057c/UK114 family)